MLSEIETAFFSLAERLVPDYGPAESVQGELVRAVSGITFECFHNGCGNWDGHFKAFVNFAILKFSDGTLSGELTTVARSMLERLRAYGRSVGHPENWPLNQPDPKRPEEEDRELYIEICDSMNEPLMRAAVEWCRFHPTPIPFTPGPDYVAGET